MSAGAQTFRRALDAAHALSESTPPWIDILGRARDLFGADSASFLQFEGNTFVEIHQTNIDRAAEREYIEHFASDDILLPGLAPRAPGTWLDTETLMPRETREANAYYRDFMCKHRMRQMRSLVLDEGPFANIGLSFQNEFAVREPSLVTEAQKIAFTQVVLSSFQRRRDATRNWFSSTERAFTALGEAVCMVQKDGCVVHASSQAHTLFAMASSVQIRNRRLWHPSAQVRAQLAQALTDAYQSPNRKPSRIHIPAGPAGADPGETILVDIVKADETMGLQGQPLLMIRISRREPADAALPSSLARYGITPAEARVLKALSQGHPAAWIAEHTGVSIHTVRKQIAMLMEKTGCSRQVDLVLLVVG